MVVSPARPNVERDRTERARERKLARVELAPENPAARVRGGVARGRTANECGDGRRAGPSRVAISHLHGDHFGGIPYLVVEQHFAGRTAPLAIGGPRGLPARLRAAELALYPDFFRKTKIRLAIRETVLGASETELGGALVSALPVKHVADAEPHGLRARVGDKLIAYSGDATWSDELVRVAKGADQFICDASFFDTDDPSHISYRTLMAQRDKLDCKRIVLTHLGAETLARIGELDLEHAVDGTGLVV